MGQILQHMVEYPLCTSPTESFMVSVFIETVRKSLKEFGYTKIENNEESGGNFLVAVKGKLFIVHSDFQINRYLGGMYSVGIGSSYALGAMYTKRNSSPEVVLKSGLIAASNFCLGVCKPFSQPMFSEKEEN
jgi:ATP-dependent protease HslVU (ClpYQ) peptidase subunit